jgi:RHH-type proline utilization regulon transcriptional repressor/proline dehydrogenase/delta 1-pyrroline-5-carboxylate dehydrogenase
VLATGNDAVAAKADALARLPDAVRSRIVFADDPFTHHGVAAALVEGDAAQVAAASRLLADRPGAIVSLQSAMLASDEGYRLDWLLDEVTTSINTTAAGGNASLMAIA